MGKQSRLLLSLPQMPDNEIIITQIYQALFFKREGLQSKILTIRLLKFICKGFW